MASRCARDRLNASETYCSDPLIVAVSGVSRGRSANVVDLLRSPEPGEAINDPSHQGCSEGKRNAMSDHAADKTIFQPIGGRGTATADVVFDSARDAAGDRPDRSRRVRIDRATSG